VFNFFTTSTAPKLVSDKLLDSLEEGVVVYGADFQIKKINKSAERILKINAQLITGKKISTSDLQNPELKTLTQLIFPSLAPAGRVLSEPGVWPQKSELEIGDPSKTLIVSLLRDETGTFFKIIRDMSDKKSVEKAREDFIAVAAHQIRTPLTALHWGLEQLKSANQDQSLVPIISESLSASERTLKIANDLLDAAQIEDGRLELKTAPLNLKDLTEKIIKQFEGLAQNKKVSLSLISSSTSLVSADENQISMVLANLIDNAIKYNLVGGRIEISIQEELEMVKTSIKDTGLGISTEELTHLFEKLYRGSEAIRVEPNGSGLGLYIAKNIIERHGGRMGANSEVNRGTTFWFTLPKYIENPDESFRF
jgi:two-component system sensor histidine kinase ResE